MTIPIRIRIAVWPDGKWVAYGDESKYTERNHCSCYDGAPGGESIHWVTADIPLPQEIAGKVEPKEATDA